MAAQLRPCHTKCCGPRVRPVGTLLSLFVGYPVRVSQGHLLVIVEDFFPWFFPLLTLFSRGTGKIVGGGGGILSQVFNRGKQKSGRARRSVPL